MFRAKDTFCITMQISIIKRWQFTFPYKERKMFSVQHSSSGALLLIKRNPKKLYSKLRGLLSFHKVSSFMICMYCNITYNSMINIP